MAWYPNGTRVEEPAAIPISTASCGEGIPAVVGPGGNGGGSPTWVAMVVSPGNSSLVSEPLLFPEESREEQTVEQFNVKESYCCYCLTVTT